MLCGAHPFDLEGNSPESEVTDRVRTTAVPLEGLGDEISDSAKDLISRYTFFLCYFSSHVFVIFASCFVFPSYLLS